MLKDEVAATKDLLAQEQSFFSLLYEKGTSLYESLISGLSFADPVLYANVSFPATTAATLCTLLENKTAVAVVHNNDADLLWNATFNETLRENETYSSLRDGFTSYLSLSMQDDANASTLSVLYDELLLNMSVVYDNETFWRRVALINTASSDLFLDEHCRNPLFNTSNYPYFNQYYSSNVSVLSFALNTTPTSLEGVNVSLGAPSASCCVRGSCFDCCIDCPKSRYPVLFIHGHAMNAKNTPESSMHAFTLLQKELEYDGFIDAGQLDLTVSPQDVEYGTWGMTPYPMTLRSTYYYISYYDIGELSLSVYTSERIENYAVRLKEMIDMVRYRTGSPKVTIVAHSIAGLFPPATPCPRFPFLLCPRHRYGRVPQAWP